MNIRVDCLCEINGSPCSGTSPRSFLRRGKYPRILTCAAFLSETSISNMVQPCSFVLKIKSFSKVLTLPVCDAPTAPGENNKQVIQKCIEKNVFELKMK